MGEPLGHWPAAAAKGRLPAWDDLSDSMQLIVVKELTSWYSFRAVVYDHLCLTREQRHRFKALYDETVRQQILADDAARASLAEQETIWEQQQHQSGVPGWSSRSRNSSSSSPPVLAMVKERYLHAEATNIVVADRREMALAQAFLRRMCIVRRAADLGHWFGHSGLERFVIDQDTHVLCAAGTHAAPDAELPYMRPYRPLPAPMPTIPEQETGPEESPPVPAPVPAANPTPGAQRSRRGRPRRQDPLSDAGRPSRVQRAQDVEGEEDEAVLELVSATNTTAAEEATPSTAPRNDVPEELSQADRINREAAAVLARYRGTFARSGNRRRTEGTDGDYTEKQ